MVTTKQPITHEQLINWMVAKKGMPRHYAEAWQEKADELGLSPRESVNALSFAMSLVGMDLDSWIWGDDLEDYIDAIQP